MTAIEIARRMAEMGATKDAVRAYTVAIHNSNDADPMGEMEAALYILQNGGDYKVSYGSFVSLHNRGFAPEDCVAIMTQAFYEPNVKLLKTRYQNNCRLLNKYPYLFRKDFLDFEFLPVRFFPYDDNRFTPYDTRTGAFGDYIDFKQTAIHRNFFHDLENPILAEDVYSQYELEYLNDTVRKSEDVARENHIYLHYPDWATFCSYLQCMNMRPLLEDKKFVFLIGDEIEQYPIDFKERFGIEYSHHRVQPFHIREINRLIWHTQLSSHNGGDFFNEIFDRHPNLLVDTSLMFDDVKEGLEKIGNMLDNSGSTREAVQQLPDWPAWLMEELYLLYDRTGKDVLVAYYLNSAYEYEKKYKPYLDRASRIAPAIFFQPHFGNVIYQMTGDQASGRTVLESKEYEALRTSPLLRDFKYIKTFTPMRRFTTSHGATLKFMSRQLVNDDEKTKEEVRAVIPDAITQRVLNRSFMIDWQDRLYADSILVRFEDGKLNPKATFTALCAFLDIPYTESMTYCSMEGQIDPEQLKGNARGFDPAPVYRTYDDYVNDAERTYIEYELRDAYEYYGYDFQYYDGTPMDEERLKSLIEGFTKINGLIRESHVEALQKSELKAADGTDAPEEVRSQIINQMADNKIEGMQQNRTKNALVLMRNLRFVNRRGQPLRMMPKLELDPALLEQPLYH